MTIGYGKTDSVLTFKNWAATDPVPIVQDLNIPIPAQKPPPLAENLPKRRGQRPRRPGQTAGVTEPEPDTSHRIDEYA